MVIEKMAAVGVGDGSQLRFVVAAVSKAIKALQGPAQGRATPVPVRATRRLHPVRPGLYRAVFSHVYIYLHEFPCNLDRCCGSTVKILESTLLSCVPCNFEERGEGFEYSSRSILK